MTTEQSSVEQSKSRNRNSDVYVATLDVGTSSVRSLLFNQRAEEMEGFGIQIPYDVKTASDGGVEVDADALADLVVKSLSVLHQQIQEHRLKISAVACCTFWHNVLGVDANGSPSTPVLHPFDTRADQAAHKLASRIDGRAQHARTGCVLHPSYLPAKLLWLSETNPAAFKASRQWMSFGEYLFLKFFGKAVASVSMVSGSGLWNQHENQYDSEILDALPVDIHQLSPVQEMDQPLSDLRPEYKPQWPTLSGVPWFPALGDGACNNIGSDCDSPERFALMVGTSGALRAVSESSKLEIPDGLWCYRVDRKRYLFGGALSNGGEVYAWMKRTLALPEEEKIESELAAMKPGSHLLTVLPFFAGERSTHWRADARATITGLHASTRPVEILRAALEAVALRFRAVYDLMVKSLGVPREVIASGGALLHSPAWSQMMADALGRSVVACLEKEATSRGAAMLALERLNVVPDVSRLQGRRGKTFNPDPSHIAVYEEMLTRQQQLYAKLFSEK
ncbi:MAG TPA: gluconokinase [Terriglobia bacterium]|nr:gluconokinase [Terriglobia bacterium]